MSMLPQPRCEVGKKCMELFKEYKGDELTLMLARYTVDEVLSLYKPQLFRKALPEIAVRYKSIQTEKERDKFNKDNPDWMSGEDMTAYAEAKRGIESENESNRCYLKDTLQRLAEDKDSARCYRVKDALALFPPVS